MPTKIKSSNKTKIMAAVLAFLVSFNISGAAFAEPGVSITDAQCTNTFQGVERTDFNITVDGLNVTTDDVKFESVGDKLVCSLTINNDTDDIVEVDPGSINAESNDHIRYNLSSSTGNTIDIDAFKTFVYTVEYVATFDEAQTFDKTLEIKLTADDIDVPNTGMVTTGENNGQEIINIAESVAIVFGIIALVALIMRKSKKQIVAPAILAILSLSAAQLTANALHIATVTVKSKIVVSIEVPEPYYGVTMSNLYGLTSNIFSNSPDNEMFPYNVYSMASTSFRGDIVDNRFTSSGAFIVDAREAVGQWTVDMTNTGGSAAMVAGAPIITGLTDEQKEFVDIKVQYEYDTPLQANDLIAPGEMKRLLIRATYKDDYTGPLHTGENISFSVEIPYVLANSRAREIHDGAGWLLPREYDNLYTYKNITSTDGRKGLSSSERPHPFMNPKTDGAVVTFQTADELDLSNAVEMDSGSKSVDLSLWQDGSVIGWIEENENSTADSKKYDYYVYSTTGEVVVDQCEYLFEPQYNNGSMFRDIEKIDLHGFNFERCASAYYMFGYIGGQSHETVTIDLGDWSGQNLYSTYYMFYVAGSNNGANIIFSDNWNPINVRNAARMFSSVGFSSSNVNIDISGWQLNNLLDMSYMFGDLGRGTDAVININARNINIPRVKNMSSVFWSLGGNSAKSVTIDASGWTYDTVTDMSSMFSETCSSPTIETCDVNIDIRTPSVENMASMFRSTSTKLTDDIDFSKFDTSKVQNMGGMFAYLRPVGDTLSLDLSSFETPALERVKSFYTGDYDTKHLELDISGFDFSHLTESYGTYDRFISSLPSTIESVVIYVKDQAAKDFVINRSRSLFGSRAIQNTEVVIK